MESEKRAKVKVIKNGQQDGVTPSEAPREPTGGPQI